LAQVLDNIRRFVIDRQSRRAGVPIIVPVFTKCRDNLSEMELWYDQWLRALGSAVITGPSDYAGQITDVGIPNMTPPKRVPCARLNSRLTILSDATVVTCEQDVLARKPMGSLSTQSLGEIWKKSFPPLRSDHEKGQISLHPLCTACREWHRP